MKTTTEAAKEIPIIAEPEVVVAGGGPGGFMAALAAARAGARTLLIEQFGALFGMATAGLMTSFNGFRNEHPPDHVQTVRGFAQELVDRLLAEGGACACTAHGHFGELKPGTCPYAVSFDPEVLKLVALEMLHDAGVDIMFHTRFCDVLTDGRQVRAALVENKSGRQAVAGRIYVDATGDGDLAARAGAQYETMADTGPFQRCPDVPPGIGRADAAGKNVLAVHTEAARTGKSGPAQQAGAEHQKTRWIECGDIRGKFP